jgi:Sulfotransferase family
VSKRPIFLLSLPRAGSTFVQRVLASHQEISTTSEPWILLPFLYAARAKGICADYNQRLAYQAINDFIAAFRNGRDDYDTELRRFVLELYRRASPNGGSYFLDKTPRYHLIVEDLFRLFPEAKYVFLWRNPLSVVASSIDTWARGRWSLHRFRIDLFDGVENLISGYERHTEKAFAIRYEDLVTSPSDTWPRLFEYLELSFDPAFLERFHKVELRGRMGDPSGRKLYEELTAVPIEKWKRSLNNPFRKAWCRRYLDWIGERRLAVMGYEQEELIQTLDSLHMTYHSLGSDVLRAAYGRTRLARRRVSGC